MWNLGELYFCTKVVLFLSCVSLSSFTRNAEEDGDKCGRTLQKLSLLELCNCKDVSWMPSCRISGTSSDISEFLTSLGDEVRVLYRLTIQGQSNDTEVLTADLFDGLTVTILELNGFSPVKINNETFEKMKLLQEVSIDFSGLDIKCDCCIRWILEADIVHIENIDTAVCTSPPAMTGIPLASVPTENLTCPPKGSACSLAAPLLSKAQSEAVVKKAPLWPILPAGVVALAAVVGLFVAYKKVKFKTRTRRQSRWEPVAPAIPPEFARSISQEKRARHDSERLEHNHDDQDEV